MSEQILRHVNGGAQKIGSEVHVSADSYADASTQIGQQSHVFGSSVINSRIWQASMCFKSRLEGVTSIGSIFSTSKARLLYAEGVVLDNAVAEGPRLIDVVAENCGLYGDWTLKGNARIPTGIWRRAPRFKRITGDNGVDIGLTESTDGHALMACWRKPIKTWLHAGPRLGNLHRWTAEQVNDARLFFEELQDVPLEGVSANT